MLKSQWPSDLNSVLTQTASEIILSTPGFEHRSFGWVTNVLAKSATFFSQQIRVDGKLTKLKTHCTKKALNG
jgi:hypothetical protein